MVSQQLGSAVRVLAVVSDANNKNTNKRALGRLNFMTIISPSVNSTLFGEERLLY